MKIAVIAMMKQLRVAYETGNFALSITDCATQLAGPQITVVH